MKTAEIRQTFIDYFKALDHQSMPSASLLPDNDPSLLFTNAGMVPFKQVFLGLQSVPAPRVVSSQRCLRAGGKHNDLDNVGYTARHHTFFEMLGNFSFGDYFKREAIQFAWRFLTDKLGLPVEKLWVTVYEDDAESASIWLDEMGIDPTRFSRCGAADNFWSMGDTGPCGPCSEIFYDHGAQVAGGPPGSDAQDGDRYVEIWNMVFMQYDRQTDGELRPLPHTAVDTGMGLERIAAVLQGVVSNYEIDIFQSIIAAARELSPLESPAWSSLCVLADHIRAVCFLIADGVLPSNEGRGYVLRRIIRRAIRHGHQCGMQSPFFHQLVGPVVVAMGEAYPQLAQQQHSIEVQLQQEETQFSATLSRGLKVLETEVAQLAQGDLLSGEVVFRLYDTYGFPEDLTADIVRDRGIDLDRDGFEVCMQAQKSRSQAQKKFVDYERAVSVIAHTEFLGYEKMAVAARVLSLLAAEQAVDHLFAGETGVVVLDQTPFYAEAGGQVGDQGLLHGANALFEVTDTQRQGEAILHHGRLKSGRLSLQEEVTAEVGCQRDGIRCHHSATHLLHAALRRRLGDSVVQKGSWVAADRLRFDFTLDRALTAADWKAIEEDINRCIRANVMVSTELMSIQEAQESGAMMLFGERYADTVRVLKMGNFSAELCGGTHVARTGDIGCCQLISESGIAAGVRRVEAVAGQAAIEYMQQQLILLDQAATQAQCARAEIVDKIQLQQAQLREQSRRYQHLQRQYNQQQMPTLLADSMSIGAAQVVVAVIEDASRDDLRDMVDGLRERAACVVFLVAQCGKTLHLLSAVSRSLQAKFPAHRLMQTMAAQLGGKGGGREDLAQGGAQGSVSQQVLSMWVREWCEHQVAN